MSAPVFLSFPDLSQSQKPVHDATLADTRVDQGERQERHSHRSARHQRDHRQSGDEKDRDRRREEKAARRQTRDEAEELLQQVLGRPDGIALPTSTFLDTAGDKSVAAYADDASRHASRFRRVGYGPVVGLHPGLRIVHSRDRHERGVEVAPRGRVETERYSRQKNDHRNSRRLLLRAGAEAFNPASSFISLGAVARQASADLPGYRRIDQSDDLDNEDHAIDGSYTAEGDQRRRVAETERHLQAHPDDVDMWIRYSTYHTSSASVSADQTRSQAEITLTILARAMDEAGNFTSSKLHIAYLHAAETIWAPDKVTARWKTVLNEIDHRKQAISERIEILELWLAYLDWRSGAGFSKGSNGGVDGVVEVYVSCMDRFRRQLDAAGPLRAEEDLLCIFVQLCFFLKQAGYSERAMGTFQAMMDITFFRSKELNESEAETSSTSGRINSTREYTRYLENLEREWEEEVPRFGEDVPRGTPSAAKTPSIPAQQKANPFQRWLHAECQAAQRSSMPGRTTDDSSDDDRDPFRVVLFSDIRPFLFQIRCEATRRQLIFAFLRFIDIRASPLNAPSDSRFNLDPRTTWSSAFDRSPGSAFWPSKSQRKAATVWQKIDGEPMAPQISTVHGTFSCPVRSWQSDSATRVGSSISWFRDLEGENGSSLDFPLARRALKLLIEATNDDELKVMAVALESTISLKRASKYAKSLLEKDQGNLDLWSAFGRLDGQSPEVSRTIFMNAWHIAGSQDPSRTAMRHQLCAEWALAELERSDASMALQAVYRGAGLIGNEGLIRLKVKNYYDCVIPTDTATIVLKGLYSYLTGDVEQFCSTFSEALENLELRGEKSEDVWQAYCHILHLHTQQHASPARLLRDTLETALERYPNNTQFLSLYLSTQLGHKIHGRVQRLITRLTSEGAQIPALLWSVWAEGQLCSRTFWERKGRGAERVRAALSRAVASYRGRRCVPLWRLYIEFESVHGRLEAAKSLCYRAIASAGACKELYLLPFEEPLRAEFTGRELHQWSEMMLERGIRCHVPFEEFWSANDFAVEDLRLPDDEEPHDDELAFLRERNALMPY